MTAEIKITVKYAALAAVFLLFAGLLQGYSQEQKQPVDYVNPYIGNISHYLRTTRPLTHLPNSMLRVSPNRGDYTEDVLNGLPLFEGFTLSVHQGNASDMEPVIGYSYDFEKPTPYSYSVYLDEKNIGVDYGVSRQSAMYELSIEKEGDVYILVTSGNGVLDWNGSAARGFDLMDNDTHAYLHMEPETSPDNVFVLSENTLVSETRAEGEDACLVLMYPEGTRTIRLRYGVSYVDGEQAGKNMAREVSGKDLATIQSTGREAWNEALGKIKVQGGNEDDRVVFYTALYRCYYRPVCISEDGRYYSPFDRKVHEDNGRPFYTHDAFWDTYLATHPLRTIIYPRMEEDILNSYVLMTGQMDQPWFPQFPGITGDRRSMLCNHGVVSVLDAYRKGLDRFDLGKAYIACKKALTEKSLQPYSGAYPGSIPAGELSKFYWENGFFPSLKVGEEETYPFLTIRWTRRQPVEVTLGTAYDCWALAMLAKELGKTGDHEYFLKHSFNYRNILHPETKFMHPRDSDGNFVQPFDYFDFEGHTARDYYGEGNAWVYRWNVQHNIDDLIDLMGGKDQFNMYLDEMYDTPLTSGFKVHYLTRKHMYDHSGNVGQYAMGNEPGMFIPYLHNYGGQPWKTQKRVRSLLDQWFRDDVMGVPGDEDGGGLSAFVVFTMMGFYPVTPGKPGYSIGSPFFEKATIRLEDGNVFEIEARNVSGDNKYIQSATLNGNPLDGPWLSHENVVKGGSLVLEMGNRPNYEWGASE